MTTKRFSAEFLAELEGEAVPFAAAPHLMKRARIGYGDQTVAVSTVREAVISALLTAGYELHLAEKIAEETANQVPVIEEKLQSAA